MEQSQFVELIRAIKPEEISPLMLFASHPYFNAGRYKEYVLPLMEYCFSCLNHDAAHQFEKKTVYEVLFGSAPFVEGKIEKVMVEAHKIIKQYLLTEQYLKDDNEFQQNIDFIKIVRARKLDDRHRLTIAKLYKMQETSPVRNTAHYFRQVQIEGAVHLMESLVNIRKGDLNIAKFLHATEIYYHHRRIELLNRYLVQKSITPLEVSPVIARNMEIESIPEAFLEESPSLNLSYQIHQLLKSSDVDTEDVKKVFQLLVLHEKNLDWMNLQEYYTYLRNFTIVQLSKDPGNLGIRRTLHELFVKCYQKGLMHYQNKLMPSRYMTAIDNAIDIGELDWVAAFIEKYKNDLYGEGNMIEVYQLAKAQLYFARRDVHLCLELLPSSIKDTNLYMLAKRLEIMCYYELESDLAQFKLDAFKVFLSRTSPKIISESRRLMNTDFANLLHQIMSSVKGDKARSAKLVKRVEEKKTASEWRWLMEKAVEIGNPTPKDNT